MWYPWKLWWYEPNCWNNVGGRWSSSIDNWKTYHVAHKVPEDETFYIGSDDVTKLFTDQCVWGARVQRRKKFSGVTVLSMYIRPHGTLFSAAHVPWKGFFLFTMAKRREYSRLHKCRRILGYYSVIAAVALSASNILKSIEVFIFTSLQL